MGSVVWQELSRCLQTIAALGDGYKDAATLAEPRGSERPALSELHRRTSNFLFLKNIRVESAVVNLLRHHALPRACLPLRAAEYPAATHVNEAADRDIAPLFLGRAASKDRGQTQEERTRLAVGSAVNTGAAVRLRSA